MSNATRHAVCFGALFCSLSLMPEVRAQPVFTRVTEGDAVTQAASSNGASWVDYDGDGDLDLFVANGWFGVAQPNALYRNDGGGVLTAVTEGPLVTTEASTFGSTWADYDNDGDLDAFVTSAGAAGSYLYVNQGDGTFEERLNPGGVAPRGWTAAWGDYDGDQFVDLVVAHPAGFVGSPATPNFLFRNAGDGTLTNVTDGPIVTGLDAYTVPSWADYDDDGDLDLFIGSGPADGTIDEDNLYRNLLAESGTAAFERIEEGRIATDDRDGQVMNWIDYDNDGDLDLYVTNWGGTRGGIANNLYRNDGGGDFRKINTGAIVQDSDISLANTWGDYDNDGDLDVFVANAGSPAQPNGLYLNDGGDTFTKVTEGRIANDRLVTWGATTGDYDGDGDLDLYTTTTGPNGGVNALYRNDTDNGNGWFKLNLVGDTSNRSAIGAKVRVKAIVGGEARWMRRDVSAQNTFNGQNALDVHFGLGDAARIDSLEITWPSGAVERFDRIGINQAVTHTEGTPFSGVLVGVEAGEGPHRFRLEANYPNPFNPTTTVRFTLAQAASVTLRVFDAHGREVQVLTPGLLAAGPHALEVDLGAAHLSSGVYLYRLDAGPDQAARSFVLLK